MNCTVNALDIQYGVNSLYIRYDSEINPLDKQYVVNNVNSLNISSKLTRYTIWSSFSRTKHCRAF